MKREKVFDDEVKVSFDDTEELRRAIAEKVYAYFVEHEVWSGEQIHQSDGPIIEAPHVMSAIADELMNFEVKYLES